MSTYAHMDISKSTHDVDVEMDKQTSWPDIETQKQDNGTAGKTNKPPRRCSSPRSRWTLFGSTLCLLITLPLLILGLIAYYDIRHMNTSIVIQTLDIMIEQDVGIHSNMQLTNIPMSVKWMPITLSQVTCQVDMIWDNITHPLATASLQQGSVSIVSSSQQVSLEINHTVPETITHTLFRLITGDVIRTIAHCSSHIKGQPFGLFSISSNYEINVDVSFSKYDIPSATNDPRFVNDTVTPWWQYIDLLSSNNNWMEQSLALHFPYRAPNNDMFKDAIVKIHIPETNYAATVYEPHYLTLSIPSFELDLSPQRHGDALIPFTMSIKGKPDCFTDDAVNNENITTWRILSCDAHLITEIVGEQHLLVFMKDDATHTYTVTLDESVTGTSNNLIHGMGTGSYNIINKNAIHILSQHTHAVTTTTTTISSYGTAIVYIGEHTLTINIPSVTMAVGGSRGFFHVDGTVSVVLDADNLFNASLSTTWDFDTTPQHITWDIREWGGTSVATQPGKIRFIMIGDTTIGHIGGVWDASLNDLYIKTSSTIVTNVSAHAQLNSDTQIIGFTFWEGNTAIALPIPLPLTTYVPASLQGVRKYGLASFQYDTSHGFALHGTTAVGSDNKLVSQAIVTFELDTNIQTLNWQLLESDNANMILTPTTSLASTRIAVLSHITALSWSTSILDLSLDTLSFITNGNIQFNVTVRGAIDITSTTKIYGLRIWESPNLSRSVPLPLDSVNIQSLSLPVDGARWSHEILGWVDTTNGFTFALRQAIQQNNNKLSHAAIVFIIDTTQHTITSLFQENQNGPAILDIVSVSQTRIQHASVTTWMNTFYGNWYETDIQLSSGYLAIDGIKQINVGGRFHINKNNYIALTIWEGKVDNIPYPTLPLAINDTSALVNSKSDGSNGMIQAYIGYDTTNGLNVNARIGIVILGNLITNITITGVSTSATSMLSWSLFESNKWSETTYPRVGAQAKGTFQTSASPYDIHIDTISLTINNQTQANISTWITIDTNVHHIIGGIWVNNDIIPPYNTWNTTYGDGIGYLAYDMYYNTYRPNTNIIAPSIDQSIWTFALGGTLITSAAVSINVNVVPDTLIWQLGEISSSPLTYPITWWTPSPYRLYTNGQLGVDRNGPYGAHIDYVGIAWNGGITSNVTGMLRIDTTQQIGTITAYQCGCAQVPVVTDITPNNINTFPSNFITTLSVYGDGHNGFSTWGRVATTINQNLQINGTASLYVNTNTERWGSSCWGASSPWSYAEPNHLYSTIHGTYHKTSGANVVDIVVEEVSLTIPNNGVQSIQFNATVHTLWDFDMPAIRLAFWENQGMVTAPIPTPFDISGPQMGTGHDIGFVLIGMIDRTNGARITSQGVIVTNTQIITNYTVGLDYNTNTYIWNAWINENPSSIVSPPYTWYRTVGWAQGSAEFHRGLADFNIATFSMMNNGITRFNISLHARVDTDNQLGGIALWGGSKPIPVTIPLQFDTYVVNPNDGNTIAYNIWVAVDTTMGALIQEHATIATGKSLLTNEYGYFWINWSDHLISWLMLEDNQMFTFQSSTSSYTQQRELMASSSSSILSPTWNQRANMRLSSSMKFGWIPVSPYNIQLAMDLTSKSSVITNVTANAGIDTTLKTLYANLRESADNAVVPRFGATTTGVYDDYSLGANDNGAGKSARFDTILTQSGDLLVNTTINGRVHQNPTTMGLQLITHDHGVDKQILNVNWGGYVSTERPNQPTDGPTTITTTPPTIAPTTPPPQQAAVVIGITFKCNVTTFEQKFKNTFINDMAKALNISSTRIHIISYGTNDGTNRLRAHIMAATTSDSIVVKTQIDPPPAGSNDTISAVAAANNLITQISDPTSPLLTNTAFGQTIDTTKVPTIVVITPTTPPPTNTPTSAPASSSSSNTPTIVGAVVGGIVGLSIIFGITWFVRKRHQPGHSRRVSTELQKPVPTNGDKSSAPPPGEMKP